MWTEGNCQEHFLCNYTLCLPTMPLPWFVTASPAGSLQGLEVPLSPTHSLYALCSQPSGRLLKPLLISTSQALLAGHSALSFLISIYVSLPLTDKLS